MKAIIRHISLVIMVTFGFALLLLWHTVILACVGVAELVGYMYHKLTPQHHEQRMA